MGNTVNLAFLLPRHQRLELGILHVTQFLSSSGGLAFEQVEPAPESGDVGSVPFTVVFDGSGGAEELVGQFDRTRDMLGGVSVCRIERCLQPVLSGEQGFRVHGYTSSCGSFERVSVLEARG